jgi:HlyD family secretion protein
MLAVITGTAGVLWLSREKPVTVAVRAVDLGRVEATVTNTRAGTVKACRRARLAPPTGGQISRLAVREGDSVEGGEIMLELWNEDLAARVTLARQEAAASRASAEQACLMADEADRDLKRQQTLQQRKLTSEETLDRAATNSKAMRANCRAARATADVSLAQVEVARAELERTRLKAPFPGTVAEVNGEIGEFVTPSPTGVPTLPAIDLVDNSCLYISAPIDEMDAPAIRPGMDARISLDAFPGKHFPGIVQRVAPYVLEVEKQARTVEVETVFGNPEDFQNMLPGYSADIEVILAVHDQVLRIPTEAILEDDRVLIYRRSDGILEERHVITGLSNWRYTEVMSGLAENEWIVVSIDRDGVTAGAMARPDMLPAEHPMSP